MGVWTAQAADKAAPRFEQYPTPDTFQGTSASPILETAEQRRYRTRIRNGVQLGEGVWTGSWRNPMKSHGPNFAGHYFVIRWGCGSQCVMMAVVDAKTGKVFGSPLRGDGPEFNVSMDPLSEFEIDFKPTSSLMVLRNGCAGSRIDCGVYYFKWQENRWTLLKRGLVDLTKEK
jgi:hypothetical protein